MDVLPIPLHIGTRHCRGPKNTAGFLAMESAALTRSTVRIDADFEMENHCRGTFDVEDFLQAIKGFTGYTRHRKCIRNKVSFIVVTMSHLHSCNKTRF